MDLKCESVNDVVSIILQPSVYKFLNEAIEYVNYEIENGVMDLKGLEV